MHVGEWRGMWRCVEQYMEVCGGVYGGTWRVHSGVYEEVHRDMQRCTEMHKEVHRGMQRCTKVCGHVLRGLQNDLFWIFEYITAWSFSGPLSTIF